jgi:hypothetical protein
LGGELKSYTYSALGANGRLGNQLWQIAWIIGSAIKNDGKVCIKQNWDYKKFFSIPEEYFVNPSGEIVNGNLFYQELHHWDSCADLVYESFQPSELSLNQLRDNYPDWFFDSAIHKTSLHIRAGDYLQHPRIFPVPSDNYYLSAMEKIESPTRFVVFSDDINYARRKLATAPVEDIVFIDGFARPVQPTRRMGEPRDQLDLFLMTLCQNHIIGNSTFSWWGAYLANSEAVYYPSVWWGPDLNAQDSRGLDVRQSWTDAIPNEWRLVEC